MGIAETAETSKRVPEFDLQSPIQCWIICSRREEHEDLDAAIIVFSRLLPDMFDTEPGNPIKKETRIHVPSEPRGFNHPPSSIAKIQQLISVH